MRDIKALAFVCVLIAACASTDGGGGDDGVDPPTGPTCGDSVCAASEIGVCQADCGSGGPSTEVCGNSKCEGNEPTTCAADCSTTAVCGNNMCESTETNATCPGDCTTNPGGVCPDPLECAGCIFTEGLLCPAGHTVATCEACILGGGGGLPMCSGGAPNGMCDQGESNATCPQDCP